METNNQASVADSNSQSEIEQLKAQIAERDQRLEKIRVTGLVEKRNRDLRTAVGRQNFRDPEDVIALVGDKIAIDESSGLTRVKDDAGNFRTITLDQFFADFAYRKPYLLETATEAGDSPSQPANGLKGRYRPEEIFGPKSNGGLANKLAMTDKAEYRRLHAIAREIGLVKF